MRVSLGLSLLSALPSLISAIPERPPFSNTTTLPTRYGILLYPGFQALDVFGPLDVLNSLTMMYDQTDMELTVLARTLSPVSTGKYGQHNLKFAESVTPTMTFEQALSENKDIEVLMVPGGIGAWDDVSAEIDYVKKMFPKVKYLLSVCTGATILARAGVLDGRKATTNKKSWAWATSTGPNVEWVPSARWVEDGTIWSSSGISAGTDLAFAFVSHLYGDKVAEYIGYSIEYQRWEGGSTYDPFAKIWEVPGAS